MTTFDRIRAILVDSLAVSENEIVEEASLSGDLGAESIDLLDMVFRLEREFDIQLSSDELFPTGIFRGDDGYVENGIITEKGLNKLKEVIPYGDFSKLGDLRQENVSKVFTVGTLVKFVESKI